MVLRRILIAAIVAVALTMIAMQYGAGQACAAQPGRYTGELMYNYYLPPDPNHGLGAQLYVSPRPTPPLVQHTYITYQPLMPHEFLYQHHRVYHRCNPDGSVTRTVVGWRQGLFPGCPFIDKSAFHGVPRLPLLNQ